MGSGFEGLPAQQRDANHSGSRPFRATSAAEPAAQAVSLAQTWTAEIEKACNVETVQLAA